MAGTPALFLADGKPVTKEDFVRALWDVGVRGGDTLFVHSDIAAFGKLATIDRDLVLGSLVEALLNAVGPGGTILMPAFTYSFCENREFDVHESRSRVGVLTEYFRRLPGTARTRHPIFSVAVRGRHQEEYLQVGMDSFGEDSVFGHLYRSQGKILVLGSAFNDSLTFLHYIEQMHGIPYRYMKTFSGTIRDGEDIQQEECTYLVRSLDQDVVVDLSRLERYLLDHGHMVRVQLGNGWISLVRSDVLFRVGLQLLDRDIRFFLREPGKESSS